MDGFSLFNVGFGELVLVLLLAGLIMGPQRIRKVARWLGDTTAKFQKLARQFSNQLNAELDATDKADLKAAMDDIRELRRQVRDLRSEVFAGPRDAIGDLQAQEALHKRALTAAAATSNGKRSADPDAAEENTIAPPTPGLPKVITVEDDPE